jgi:alpha-ketoglutarate-dependent 2,4-dichlorophenoxyacetate dioxygenase
MTQEDSMRLLDEIMSFATRAEFVYRHRWRENDVVVWDNRCTMHRGRPFDEAHRRSMRRATVQDEGPTVMSATESAA